MLGYLTFFAALAGAALYFVKFGLPLKKGLASDRKLQVLETRPLGNKQYLLVVGYEDTRMLLGVTPGKIDYLCPLDSTTAPADFSTMMGSVENQAPRSRSPSVKFPDFFCWFSFCSAERSTRLPKPPQLRVRPSLRPHPLPPPPLARRQFPRLPPLS